MVSLITSDRVNGKFLKVFPICVIFTTGKTALKSDPKSHIFGSLLVSSRWQVFDRSAYKSC